MVSVEIINIYFNLTNFNFLFQGKESDSAQANTPGSVSQCGVWLRAVLVSAESDSHNVNQFRIVEKFS